MLHFLEASLAVATLGAYANGFVATSCALSRRRRAPTLMSIATDVDAMGGVAEFEEWFASLPNAFSLPAVKHKNFGSLRGLGYNGEPPVSKHMVLSVPPDVILKSSFADPDWDVQLALQLWDECQKGDQSKLYGYCSLLVRGTPLPLPTEYCPPSTAPNALRHWTENQTDLLKMTNRGRKLLELNKKQEEQWLAKYPAERNMSFEQFQWAMEAVHSRAFKGEFSQNHLASFLSAATPVLAAIAGSIYLQDNTDPSDTLLLSLAFVAAAPTLWSLLNSGKSNDAVLLPFIDSANHLESADSIIEYEPLKNAVTLRIGNACVIEVKGEKQLYLSYGSKTDEELMLNYGFLPSVADDPDKDIFRRSLARTFLGKT